MKKDLFKPIRELQIINRDLIKPNDYNPNKVLRKNLDLLKQSILSNGFCFPIVVRPNMTIIDGFHRWMVSGEEPLKTLLENKVPIVIVAHDDQAGDMYGTVTFNRARGTHLLEPMQKMVQALLEQGKSVDEIAKQMGMSNEEVYRLSNLSRQQFLDIMTERNKRYSKGKILIKG